MAKLTGKKLDKSWLGDVPDDKVFRFSDGRVARNMQELAAALREMSDDVFDNHLNGDKNDFSNWLSAVVGDTALAKDLRRVATQATAIRKVDARAKSLASL
jgi:hypothetical protein